MPHIARPALQLSKAPSRWSRLVRESDGIIEGTKIVTNLRESEGERLSTLVSCCAYKIRQAMGTNSTAGNQSWSIRTAIATRLWRNVIRLLLSFLALAFATWLLISSNQRPHGSSIFDCARKGADGNWDFPIPCPNGSSE
jgi:hypothetical protein